MAGRLQLRIITPKRQVVDREVDAFNVVALDGEVGLLPGHAALLARLRPGEASFRDGENVDYYALGDGFLELSDDVATVLVNSAEPGREIDPARAEERRKELEQRLADERLEEYEQAHAQTSLAKQVARIQVSGRY